MKNQNIDWISESHILIWFWNVTEKDSYSKRNAPDGMQSEYSHLIFQSSLSAVYPYNRYNFLGWDDFSPTVPYCVFGNQDFP